MDVEQAPTHCRYDGCTLGPDGGAAPLVQPLRGGNLREYCSDRHRIAAHRARHRRPVAPGTPGPSANPAGAGSAPPGEIVAELLHLAESLQSTAAEVGRIVALGDADRVARMLEDARLTATEAEGRATVAGAERDRERAAASAFREMAAQAVDEAERSTSRAEVAETAADAARAELVRADAERERLGAVLAEAEDARRAAEAAARTGAAQARQLRDQVETLKKAAGEASERHAAELAQARAEAAEAVTAAEVAREQARAAEALRSAAEATAAAQLARAEEALAARADLARALATPSSGRARRGKQPAG